MSRPGGRARRVRPLFVTAVAALALVAPSVASIARGAPRAAAVTTTGTCAPSGAGTTCTFSYNGTNGADGQAQTYTVPPGIASVIAEAWGAQGGGSLGGLGGHAKATLAVTPGEVLTVRAGGKPTGASGGFNGGGAGATDGEGGGGASDVRRGGDTLATRVLVAGGGGAEGTNEDPSTGVTSPVEGGRGGGTAGTTGDERVCIVLACAGGGTASAGGTGSTSGCGGFTDTASSTPGGAGTLGQGGAGGSVTCTNGLSEFRGKGGGGGLYGGGGGGTLVSTGPSRFIIGAPGGGGSGWIAADALDPLNETGVRAGNGLVTITTGAPAAYSSSYRVEEAPWLYTDAVFLHEPTLALVQRDAAMFMAYLAGVLETNHTTPPVLGPSTAPGPLTITTSYSAPDDTTLAHAAAFLTTDVPSMQRLGVQLLYFIISISS